LTTTAVIVTLVGANLAGLPYFLLDAAERVRSPLHPWFKPSGYVGQSAGIVAFALFLFLWLYPMRKRFPRLAFTGSVAAWLRFHVLAGLCIPLLAALHASWRFTGLIGLGYGAMMVAWTSGIVGRYLYARIPRRRDGLELTKGEVEAERRRILEQIAEETGLDPELIEHIVLAGTDATTPKRLGVAHALVRLVADDLRRWRNLRQIRWTWHGEEGGGERERELTGRVRRLVRREIALTQQLRMLDATHRLFRYWHVAHRPMAISALVAVVLHVGTAISLGVTWFSS
jgi:hypothetical protein